MKSVFSIFFMSLVSVFCFSAEAYQIEKATYDSHAKLVYVNLVFEGGQKEHHFTPSFDECDKSSSPYQQSVRLIDSGWNDTGTSTLRATVTIDLSGSQCLPAELTVFASRSHITIDVE